MTSMSDAELLKVVGIEYKDYRPEALEIARAELDSRGVAYRGASKAPRTPSPGSEDGQNAEDAAENEEAEEGVDEDDSDQDEFRPSFCTGCGAPTRTGYLFSGSSEMTVVFSDNNEERFLELEACARCGRVRLIVDFDTDVAE